MIQCCSLPAKVSLSSFSLAYKYQAKTPEVTDNEAAKPRAQVFAQQSLRFSSCFLRMGDQGLPASQLYSHSMEHEPSFPFQNKELAEIR